MPQDWDGVYNGGDFMATTMIKTINWNCETLRSKFSELNASAPIAMREFQWWVEWTSAPLAKLKIRDATNTEWIEIYDIQNKKFIFSSPGNITASDINDAARKPILVYEEDIEPNSCSLKTKFSGATLPFTCNELFSILSTSLGWLSSSPKTLYTTQVYIPTDMDVLWVRARLRHVTMTFTVGTLTSSGVTQAVDDDIWVEDSLDISSLTKDNWYDFTLDCTVAAGPPFTPFQALTGLTSRWGE